MEGLIIGRIPYLNLFPFFYYLERLNEPYFEFLEDVPSGLNRRLRSGEVDVSPSSSVEYLMNEELYEIIEGHSVSSIGPVRSIILFSRLPLKDLKDRVLLVTNQSETSVIQLRIILNIFLGMNVKTMSSTLPLEEGLKEYPAYLLIGDEAMKGLYLRKDLYTYDLGELWFRYTGLPFVYALWIVRKDISDTKKELVTKLKGYLDMIKKDLLENPHRIAHIPPISKIIGKEEVSSYWRSLSYDLTEGHRKALGLFRDYARMLQEIGD